MARYELMLVLNPTLEEEAAGAALERLRQIITDQHGTVESEEVQGRRHLVYPIRKQRDGNFVLTRFEIPPQAVRQVEAGLRVDERVLRHLLVRL
ncbi:MAG: 30S ribosomal protein S6 [Chloroflexi bacterium]|nr:30S ribosomal protein S6 [Chloroflexota bacterium]